MAVSSSCSPIFLARMLDPRLFPSLATEVTSKNGFADNSGFIGGLVGRISKRVGWRRLL